jgi:hypothetical protein
MKHFSFVRKNDKYHRNSGTTTFDLWVYEIKNNIPKHIASKEISTGSMRGEISEAARLLVANKYIPKTWLTDNGYYDYKNSKYKIHEM